MLCNIHFRKKNICTWSFFFFPRCFICKTEIYICQIWDPYSVNLNCSCLLDHTRWMYWPDYQWYVGRRHHRPHWHHSKWAKDCQGQCFWLWSCCGMFFGLLLNLKMYTDLVLFSPILHVISKYVFMRFGPRRSFKKNVVRCPAIKTLTWKNSIPNNLKTVWPIHFKLSMMVKQLKGISMMYLKFYFLGTNDSRKAFKVEIG